MTGLTSILQIPYEWNADYCCCCAVVLLLGIEPRPHTCWASPYPWPTPLLLPCISFQRGFDGRREWPWLVPLKTAKMVTSHKDNEPCNYSSENCIFNFLGSSHQWNLQLCCKCHLCHLVWVSFYLKEIYKCIIDEIIYCLETVWPASLLFYLIICYVHSYKWHPDRFLTA